MKPTNQDKKYMEWVALARLTSQQYANMLLEALREKDIPAVIHDQAGYFGVTGQMGVSSFRPVGGAYTLMVPLDFIVDADQEGRVVIGDDEWEQAKLVDIVES